jgi:hypothetical protein
MSYLEEKVAAPVQKIYITAVGDPQRWPRATPLSAKVGTNFEDKRRPLGRCNGRHFLKKGQSLKAALHIRRCVGDIGWQVMSKSTLQYNNKEYITKSCENDCRQWLTHTTKRYMEAGTADINLLPGFSQPCLRSQPLSISEDKREQRRLIRAIRVSITADGMKGCTAHSTLNEDLCNKAPCRRLIASTLLALAMPR